MARKLLSYEVLRTLGNVLEASLETSRAAGLLNLITEDSPEWKM